MYLNGKILQSISAFQNFPIDFLSALTFILNKKIFTVGDRIITEGESGNELYFVVSGKVSVIHKATNTHIAELCNEDYFGEISFFSSRKR